MLTTNTVFITSYRYISLHVLFWFEDNKDGWFLLLIHVHGTSKDSECIVDSVEHPIVIFKGLMLHVRFFVLRAWQVVSGNFGAFFLTLCFLLVVYLFSTLMLLNSIPTVEQHGPKKHSMMIINSFFMTPQLISSRARPGVIHQIWVKATLAKIHPQ